MSWISSTAANKQNAKNDLSFYHGFSKTPVEPTSTGTAATSLANASTKGGHTVIGTEVWAEEIPWFGLVPSRAVAVTRLSGLTKLNDLVKVDGEGGQVYKYIGADDAVFTEDQWSSFWQAVTLTNGMELQNRHGDSVLRYYLNQPMQTLTTTNNAAIDSKGYATRLFVDESNHTGLTSGGSVVSQFAAGTDNIKNGIPSVELNPKLYLGTTEKVAGTHYYDYNVSGTILWSTVVTSSSPKISCFRYIGKTVTGQLATIDSAVTLHSNEISEIKDKLGLGGTDTPGTPTLGGRVTDNEAALRTLLGLEGNAKVVATESIATTANTVATSAITTALAEGGSIAQAIATAKDEAIANAKVTLTAGNGITIPNSGSQDTAFTVSVDTTVIATVESVTNLAATVSTLSQVVASNKVETDAKIAAIETQLASGSTATAIAEAKAAAQAAQSTADAKVASVTGPTTGLVTVTGDKDVTITVSDEIATKTDAATAASTAITTSLAGTTADTIGGAISTAVSGLETKLTTGEGSLGAKVTALEGSVKTINETTIPNAITTAQNGAVAAVKALTLTASDSDDAAKVTVILGGTVETPTITVTSSDIASAQTLSELSSKVNTHIEEAAGLYLSVEKVDVLPADAEAKTNKIYLVPVDTEEGREQNIHTEYIWTNGQWEVIGTTAIDMNSLEAAAAAAQSAADKAQGEVDALELVVGGINDKIGAMDATKTVNGLTVTQVDGTITGLEETLITASVPAGTTSVEGNVAYVGSAKHVIAPEKFQTAATMPATLTSWVADLSNLVDGTAMFKGCTGLTVFVGDLSALTNGTEMFHGCTLNEESLEILAGTLPTVASGTIDIGASTNASEDVIATIKEKGWTPMSNGTAL